MPTSFKGTLGKIIYSLEARLTRSMRVDSKAKSEFTLVSQQDMSLISDLMEPQDDSKDKDVTFFASGNVSLNVHTERMGYLQGEELKVRTEIVNNSTRSVTPKFRLYEKQSFYAQSERRVYTNNILKEKGDPLPAGTRQNNTKILNIPPQLSATIFKCPIVKLEYRLKVILDIKLSRDLEIKLPIVVLPATQPPQQQQPPPPPPYSNVAFGTSIWDLALVHSHQPTHPSQTGEEGMEEKK